MPAPPPRPAAGARTRCGRGGVRSSSEPPMRSASSRPIARPEAGAADLVAGVEALEDALARRAARCPGPSSVTTRLAEPFVDLVAVWVPTLIAVPSGVCVSALSMRIRMICATLSGSAARGRPGALARSRSRPGGGRRSARTRPTTRRATSASSHPLAADLDRVGVELREVEQVDRELGQPVDLLAHRPHELGPRLGVGVLLVEQLDEPGEREDRRPQLVRGVGDELLAGAVEHREALLHLVEGHRELADLVAGVDRDRGREVAVRRPSRRPPRAAAGGARARPRPGSRRRARRRARSRRRSGSGGGSARRCPRRRRGRWRRPRPSAGRRRRRGRRRSPRRARRRPPRPRSRSARRSAAAAAAG